MADVGLRYLAHAPFLSHNEGSAITYGLGKEIGMMISADVTINRNSNKLRANDTIAEEDNSITSAEITTNIDDLTLANEKILVGLEESGTGDNKIYEDADMVAPLGGVGYVRVRSKTDQVTGITTRSYIGTWWYKVRARIESESYKTKGDTTEWSTPVLKFSAAGVIIDDSDKMKFRARGEFSTYKAAKAFVDNFANIGGEDTGNGEEEEP